MFNDDTTEEEVEETTEEEEVGYVETEPAEEEEEDTTDWKAVALEEKAKREKAEQTIIKAKQKPKAPAVANASGLSATDLIALTKANLEETDLDDVLDYASYKKITVAEALRSSVVKATLAENAEKRKSSIAVNNGSGRRATNGTSEDQLLANARAGKMPDSEADMARLAEARLKNRK